MSVAASRRLPMSLLVEIRAGENPVKTLHGISTTGT
jgi:hypothetical protein